jgi:protein-tyrosine phosphatase
VIDLHSHILPGLDDGVATMAEAVELGRAAVRDGITAMAATPHVSYRYPTSAAAMEHTLRDVAAALRDDGVPLEVLPGGELTIDQAASLAPRERRRFGLGGSARHLLIEFPYHGWPMAMGPLLDRLRVEGVTPVIAHPERSAEVRADPERLRPLVEGGALVQLTAASLDARASRDDRAVAMDLVARGLAHLIASDAHSPRRRQVGMADATRAVGDRRLAAWLSREVPAAIVAGVAAPPRPAGPRRRRWWSR